MTRDEVAALVNVALDRLVQDDLQLLDLKLCERALHFKIAHYMAQSQSIRPPLTLDCEYNRHLRDEKRLRLFGNHEKIRLLRAWSSKGEDAEAMRLMARSIAIWKRSPPSVRSTRRG